MYQGKINQAHDKMRQALKAINIAIKQDPENEKWIIQQSIIYIEMLENSRTNIDNNAPYNIKVLAKRLIDDQVLSSSTKKQELWALYELAAAQYLMHTGDVEKSLTYAKKATNSFQQLIIQFDKKSLYKAKLAENQVSQATILKLQNQPEQAKLLCRQTLNLLSQLITTTNDPEYSIPYARSLDCVDELALHPQILQQLQSSAITDYHFIYPQQGSSNASTQ